MQFMVTAMDSTDSQANDRRLAARPEHLAKIKPLIAAGRFLSGGAILSEQGQVIGSTLHVEFPSKEDLNNYLQQDPYVKNKVWEQIEIHEVRLVDINNLK